MKKFSGLEFCRFLSALAVIVFHYQNFFVNGLWKEGAVTSADRAIFPLYSILSPLYEGGSYAVQVFWIISGLIFFWKYGDAVHDKSITPSSFVVWRFSRLYPLHFATLIGVAVMQPLYQASHGTPFIFGAGDGPHFLAQLAMASNWIVWTPTFNGPIWSVSAEILVYLLFLLVVRLARPSIVLCAGIIVAAKLMMHWGWLYHPPLDCVLYFFAGGLIQRVLARLNAKYQIMAFWSAVGVAAAILVGIHLGIVVLTWTSLSLFVLATSLVAACSLLDRVVTWRLTGLARLGDLTYASYLLHFPLQLAAVLAVDALGIERTVFLSPFAFLLFILVAFLSAAIVHRHFEMPAQNLIRGLWVSRVAARVRNSA